MKTYISSVLLVLFLFACKTKNDITPALNSITPEFLKKDISVLASDEFAGRFPATEGETKTINYLADRFGELGLEPANKGSWFQEVSMIRLTSGKDKKLSFSGSKGNISMTFFDDFIGATPQPSDKINIENSDVIFAGYGINAPEYRWNDYAGLDVKGKTVIVMVNDPGYATGDTALFTGKAMTYYGRWTYKYEEAARQGAAALMIIHETGAASYPWGVVQNSWSGPQFHLEDNEFIGSGLQFTGWLTTDAATRLFTSAGLNYDELTAAASKRGFKPVNMDLQANISFSNSVEHVKSNNVAALWPGSDLSDEYIIFTAHWDHLGINPDFKPDSVLNGAVDNATGTAALLAIAKAFTSLPGKQKRSVLFLSVTGEEQGLLGSEYYAGNPIFPLNKTAAVINMDALNITGPTKDMTIIGYGNSELDGYLEAVLKKYGRYANPDPTPEKGGYFRSDHFSFAKKGVPSLYPGDGFDDVQHGKEWGLAGSEKWTREHYHKPSDNYEPDKWNFEGMTDDIKVYFETGYELSMTGKFPEWSSKFPFKNLREQMMKGNNK